MRQPSLPRSTGSWCRPSSSVYAFSSNQIGDSKRLFGCSGTRQCWEMVGTPNLDRSTWSHDLAKRKIRICSVAHFRELGIITSFRLRFLKKKEKKKKKNLSVSAFQVLIRILERNKTCVVIRSNKASACWGGGGKQTPYNLKQ